jgi:hypothetical protein
MRFLLYEGESSRLNGIVHQKFTLHTHSLELKHVSYVLFKVVILLDKRD